MRVACALTRFFDQWRCVCSAAQMAWPRVCAARIIATLESLYALRDSSGSTMKRSLTPNLYLLCDTMKSIAARISASVSAGLPALGGIAPLPLSTDCSSASLPCCRRGAHAALSPGFGALAPPAVSQAVLLGPDTVWQSPPPGVIRRRVGS